MLSSRRALAITLATTILLSLPAASEDWTEFRGPRGTGISTAKNLPLQWTESTNIRWKTAIHGKGWSSPVCQGKELWLTTATEDGRKLYAVCVDRMKGTIVHDILVFENENPRFCHPTNSYASPTPVIDDGRVYVHFGSYGTACLDSSSGKILWTRRDLSCNHWRGPGSSPIIDGDHLIVAYDGYDLQFVVAMHKLTGEIVWKRDRNIDYGTDNGDRKKAYSTGAIIEYKDRRQFISPSAVETISYDPVSGKELWRVRHGGMNAAIRPLFGNGLVYILGGSGPTALIAVRPDGSGDITETHMQWSYSKSVPKRPAPLLIGERLFLLNDEGIASCLDATSSEIIWQKRVPGSYRSSPVYSEGKIYWFSLEGDGHVLSASDEYKLLATNKLDNGCQASPVPVGDTLYVRTTKHLYAIGSR
jgi:outer membrane protein assembly factor BamB